MKKLVAFGLVACACGGDSSPNDGGADVQTNDVAPKDVVEAGPSCGTSGWLTYGHDAARTFASDGCIVGPLTPSWTYTPAPKTSAKVNAVHHALAATDAVYLQWANSDDPYIGTTAADGISTTTHMRIWTYDSGSDANMGNWASVSGANLIVNDDGIYWVSLKDGTSTVTTGVDWWGQTIADNAGGAWFVTTSKSDGPGLFVGEIDATAKVTWSQNKQGTACGDALGDKMGGIALDGGVLFYAPQYSMGGTVQPTYKSGLYAFDAVAGTPKWKVDTTTPSSTISAGNGLVYLIESGNLVARKQTDGTVSWTKPLAGAGAQAPVIAGSIVIAAGSQGVSSFDAKTGAPGVRADHRRRRASVQPDDHERLQRIAEPRRRDRDDDGRGDPVGHARRHGVRRRPRPFALDGNGHVERQDRGREIHRPRSRHRRKNGLRRRLAGRRHRGLRPRPAHRAFVAVATCSRPRRSDRSSRSRT